VIPIEKESESAGKILEIIDYTLISLQNDRANTRLYREEDEKEWLSPMKYEKLREVVIPSKSITAILLRVG
jgi:hypothetical protein